MNDECTIKHKLFKLDTNMGKAIGIGFVFDPEYYLFINIWKYSIAIGWLTEYVWEDN